MGIIRNESGIWEIRVKTKDPPPIYWNSLEKYLNCLDPLFEKAKNKSEFEFIFTLLRVRGLQSAGWDPWENTIEAIDCLARLKKKIRDFKTTMHLFLWLYGHIVEASEPYETTANLIRIIDGKAFHRENFPPQKSGKYLRPQSPKEKIDTLIRMASKINMSNSVFPFQDAFDRELRNAIFHSDYILYGNEVRLSKAGTKVYSHDEILGLINKAPAYFATFKGLISRHIQSYQSPKVISVRPGFSDDPNEKAITIIRRKYGLAGLKDNWKIDELKRGKIPWRVGWFLRYEQKMLNKDPTLVVLPTNRIKKINKILKFLPKFLTRKIVKALEKYEWS